MPKQRATVLRAARYFDGRGDAVVDGGVVVLVENGLITHVGKAPPSSLRPTAEISTSATATLPAGLHRRAHPHDLREHADYYKDDFVSRHRPATEQAFYAASYAKRLLEAGFTTVRDLGSSDLLDVGLRNAIKADSSGPRMLVAVHSLSATGGHGTVTALRPTVSSRGRSTTGCATAPTTASRRCACR